MDDAIWRWLKTAWRTEAGPFDDLAVYERIQASRTGFAALLLNAGQPVGFVKARSTDKGPLQNEFAALDSIGTHLPAGFAVPRPISTGSTDTWHYLLTTALEPHLHGPPVNPPMETLIDEIQSGLADLPRPGDIPHHWEPMHGDFTPWNLRGRRNQGLFLIDWEDAGWAPPGADEVYYRAVERVLGKAATVPRLDEPRAFWIEKLRNRHQRAAAAGDTDANFTARMASELTA
jgi:hypothetical protein